MRYCLQPVQVNKQPKELADMEISAYKQQINNSISLEKKYYNKALDALNKNLKGQWFLNLFVDSTLC
jgi:hypothetical protein